MCSRNFFSSELALSASRRPAVLQWALSDMTEMICIICPPLPPRPPSTSPSP